MIFLLQTCLLLMLSSSILADTPNFTGTENCSLMEHQTKNFRSNVKHLKKSLSSTLNLNKFSKHTMNILNSQSQSQINWTTTMDIILNTLTTTMQQENKNNISYSTLQQITSNLPPILKIRIETLFDSRDSEDTLANIYCMGVPSLELAKYLLQIGFDINSKNYDDETVLHTATTQGFLNVIEWLIKDKNMNVNDMSAYDGTPLHVATKYGHFNIVKWLLNNTEVNIDQKNNNGETALFFTNNYINITKYLINIYNADTSIRDNAQQTFLHIVAREGNLELIKFLVEDVKMDMNAQNDVNETAMHVAYEHAEIVKYLLQQGADYHLLSNIGTTILRLPAAQWQIKTVKAIIENSNIDVNIQDMFGNTALHTGTELVEIVKILVEQGKADVNIKNYDGQLPIHMASYEGHLDSVKWFVTNTKFDINVQDSNGNSLLHLATGHLDVIKYLINKVNLNIRNKKGQNVLEKSKEDYKRTMGEPWLSNRKNVYEWLKNYFNVTDSIISPRLNFFNL